MYILVQTIWSTHNVFNAEASFVVASVGKVLEFAACVDAICVVVARFVVESFILASLVVAKATCVACISEVYKLAPTLLDTKIPNKIAPIIILDVFFIRLFTIEG